MTRRDRSYVSKMVAAATLNISMDRLQHYVESGLIGTRQLPGTRTRYCMADVEAIKERYTTPAKTAGQYAVAV